MEECHYPTTLAAMDPAESNPWSIARVDIRSPLAPNSAYFARVELLHENRGRVTDIGAGTDALNAAFAAVAHIFHREVVVVFLQSTHRADHSRERRDAATAIIVVEYDGEEHHATGTGLGAFDASLAAFIAAMNIAGKRPRPRSGLEGELSDWLNSRPFKVGGLDENGDCWLFASDDEGAASAIAAEFDAEEYRFIPFAWPFA